jgi:hypothetical protein
MMELKNKGSEWKKKRMDNDFEFYMNKKYHLSLWEIIYIYIYIKSSPGVQTLLFKRPTCIFYF